MCVKTGSGDLVWGLDLVEDFGSEVPYWYTAQCPIIDGDKVILAPCGDDLIIAVELATGHILWRIPNPHNCKMSHSSIMPMELNGQKIYIYCAVGGIIGFSDKGEVFWETENWQAQVIAPSPVILVDGKFFVTTGYGAGSMMLQVVANNEGYDIIELYSITPKEGLTCEQHSPIYWNGFLFGVLPREAGYMRNQFLCFHPEGYIQWSSGTENRFGLGPFILADNKFFILDDFGLLTMIEASTTGYNQLGQAKILEGPDAWAPLSITEGLLLARDLNRMVCIDLRDQP
jgi:outer membrane protein assembly factor BamB